MSAWFDAKSKDRIVAGPQFNRWRVPPASIAIHLCIGSVYAWSIFNPPLTRALGVVASAPGDWSLSAVVWIFSVAIVFLGLSAAVGGRWLERVGPRVVGLVAACCWGGGFFIAAVGVWLHQLWLLYLGYGVLGGVGLGLGYVSPVSTLIRWFPDRRGMATGMAIMGFGGGAIVATPVQERLLSFFSRTPERIGGVEEVVLRTQAGRRLAQVAGQWIEVVVVAPSQGAAATSGSAPGVYLVGSGDTGVAATFLVLGGVYFVVMVLAALSYRIPAEGWSPPGYRPPDPHQADGGMITRHHVDIDEALKTPQFYLLWVVLCFNVTAGIGVLGVAKTMMSEIFGSTLPHIVDAGFAATYVLMISVFNMVGRFGWASLSDRIGRKRTYAIFFSLGTLLYVSIPFVAQAVAAAPSVTWLVAFYAVTMLIFTMYGGGFATIPAYLADVFGTKFVGGIHGRLLTAWSVAGVLGPLAITSLREASLSRAIVDLAAKIDDAAFAAQFGAGKDQLQALIAAKSVTLQALLPLAPPGTPDPSPTLYNSTMWVMAALLVVAFFANLSVRPVDPKHYLRED